MTRRRHDGSGGLELPAALITVRDTFPWERVDDEARRVLGERVPELKAEVAALPRQVFGLASGFFYLPATVAAEWGEEDPTWLQSLLVTLAIGHAHFAVQDQQIDGDGATPAQCLLSDIALLTYLDRLGTMAPPDDAGRYRRRHDEFYRWYVGALTLEVAHRDRLHRFGPDEIVAMGLKAAPGNTTLHVVADRTGRSDASDPLVDAVMRLCAGLQILDDLDDMADDLRRGNLSMPLTEVLLTQDEGTVDAEDVVALAAATGVTTSCLVIADHLFGLAATSGRAAGADVVVDLATVWINRAAARRRQVEQALVDARSPA
ncbi:MAG TPA: hypothetical protein VK507_23035 [Iamia sp.]|nr:hypothetical protein [Iamia sp.]